MRRFHGFTLIELLIVVAIIAILAAIAVPNFLEAQVRSKISATKADMRSIVTALESYHVDNNSYPYYSDPLFAATAPQFMNSGDVATTNIWRGYTPYSLTTPIAYMTSIPKDVFAHAKGYGSASNVPQDVKDSPYAKNTLRLYHYEHAKSPMFVDDWPIAAPPAVKFMLLGVGPDLYSEISTLRFHNNALEYLLNRNGAMGTLYGFYDPTNGTVSQGDIVYHGPGVGFERTIVR